MNVEANANPRPRRQDERVERARSAIEAAGITVEVPANIRAAIWSKFLFITAVSGVGAATRPEHSDGHDLRAVRERHQP